MTASVSPAIGAPLGASLPRPALLRTLAVVAILGSPMMLAEGLLMRQADGEAQRNVVMGLCSLVYIAGFGANAVGLRLLRATGDGRASRIVFAIQLVLLALAVAWAARFALQPTLEPSALLRVTDAAWPLGHLYMLVVGGMALKSRRLAGWRRAAPLGVGLVLPVFSALRAADAPQPVLQYAFPVLALAAGAAVALAVYTSAGRRRG